MTECPSSYIATVKRLFAGLPMVLLVREDTKIRCTCYNDLEHSYDIKCQICVGTGWIPALEKHHAYYQSSGTPSQLPRLLDVQEPAVINSNARMFYFYANATVNEGDTIVILRFNERNIPLFETMEFFTVNHTEPKFDENGIYVYTKAAAEKAPIEAKSRSVAIYNLYNTAKQIDIPL
jgi:hypothetical protein